MAPRPHLRCLVVGGFPEPDLELVARLAGPGVELLVVPPGQSTSGIGAVDCIWRLFSPPVAGTTPDPFLEAMDAHPEVRWVHTVSAGLDHLGEVLAERPGVVLTNSVGVVAAPIAEFVVGCLLQHCKRNPELWARQRERRFEALPLRELGDLRVVLFGLGAIGAATARLLAPFGSHLVGVRRRPGRDGDELVRSVHPSAEMELACRGADALVLAAPLTAKTKGVVSDRLLGQLNPGSCLVNIARGGLINEPALLSRLNSGPLTAAYLDAFEEEPLPAESPLWGAPGVFISPHISWSSGNFARRACELFGEQLGRFARGEPLRNVADPVRGY
ncbi:MAG: D-2-hydroxyacid dehydrogenase [Candidatus Dormibacteria bacterium]